MTELRSLAAGQPDAWRGRGLPNHDQLSLINANITVAVNPAVAADVLPDGSIAAHHPGVASTSPGRSGCRSALRGTSRPC